MSKVSVCLVIALMSLLTSSCKEEVEQYADGYYKEGVYFYHDGTRGEGQLSSGKKEGKWSFFDAERRKTAEGSFIDNLEDGVWKYYSEDGKTDWEGNFFVGLPNGHWKYYWPNGKEKREGDFKRGIQVGFWQYFDAEGNKQSIGQLDGEKRVGRWEFWYSNGQQKEIRFYENDQNLLAESWEQDGSRMVIGGNGYYEYWDAGKKLEEGAYKDSLMDGLWSFWNAEGVLVRKTLYEKGQEQ